MLSFDYIFGDQQNVHLSFWPEIRVFDLYKNNALAYTTALRGVSGSRYQTPPGTSYPHLGHSPLERSILQRSVSVEIHQAPLPTHKLCLQTHTEQWHCTSGLSPCPHKNRTSRPGNSFDTPSTNRSDKSLETNRPTFRKGSCPAKPVGPCGEGGGVLSGRACKFAQVGQYEYKQFKLTSDRCFG